MLKKIYKELVLIRKELQAIRRGQESCSFDILFDRKHQSEKSRPTNSSAKL